MLDQSLQNPSKIGDDQDYRLLTIPKLMAEGKWRFASPRNLSTDVYIWVTRGQGRVLINGIPRGFAAHSLLYLPTPHAYGFEIAANGQGYVLFVGKRSAKGKTTDPARIKAQSIFDQGQITGYLENIHKETTGSGVSANRVIDSYVALLDVWIERNRRLNAQSTKDSDHLAAMRIVQQFAMDLESNFRCEHKVVFYAARQSVTATHLTRVCQLICKKSASAIIQDRLALEAKIQLTDSGLKINAISQTLGFTSPAYFSRFFTKHTGFAPKSFRRASAVKTVAQKN